MSYLQGKHTNNRFTILYIKDKLLTSLPSMISSFSRISLSSKTGNPTYTYGTWKKSMPMTNLESLFFNNAHKKNKKKTAQITVCRESFSASDKVSQQDLVFV